MKRKVLSVLFATVLTAGVLAGCGSADSSSDKTTSDAKEETLDEDSSEGLKAVDDETAAKALSDEEAEKAGFSDSAEDSSEDSTAEESKDASDSTESDKEDTEAEEESDTAESEDFSDGSEDAAMAGTTVIDTSKQLTGTHHAEITVKDYGEIDVELDADTAPITVTNFVKLVQDNFYDGLTFHRIIDGFMIQGGDPNGDGTGGANEDIKGEFTNNGVKNDISHVRGTISMARGSDPDSASSQFFIVQSDSTYLDGDYAAFGHVTSGMDVVDRISKDAKPTDSNGSIADDQQPVIESIRMVD